MVQNPHSWQALGRERPATYGDFEKKIIRQKRFSDFAENFLRCSSDKINLVIFGVLRENFLMGLKMDFKFEILGILVQNPHR